MSKFIESVSSLQDPRMKAARKRQAKMKTASVIRRQASVISRALGGANKYANQVFNKFANDDVVQESDVIQAARNLAKIYAGLKRTARKSQYHLAKCLQGGFPTNKVLAQLEANYALQAKVASLLIQAKTSRLAADEEVTEEVLPVDDAGYAVDPNSVIDQPDSGVMAEEGEEVTDVTAKRRASIRRRLAAMKRRALLKRRASDELEGVEAEDDTEDAVTAKRKALRRALKRRAMRRRLAEEVTEDVESADDTVEELSPVAAAKRRAALRRRALLKRRASEGEDTPADEVVEARRRALKRRALRRRAAEEDAPVTDFTSEDVDISDESLDSVTSALFRADIAEPSIPQADEQADGLVNSAGTENDVPEDMAIVKEVEARRRAMRRQALKRKTASARSYSMTGDQKIRSLFSDITAL